MPMDAPCCEHAMKAGQEQEARKILPLLKSHAATLPLEKRRDFVKSFLKVSTQYAELVDTLVPPQQMPAQSSIGEYGC